MSANIQLSSKHRTWVLVSCILQQFAFLCISFGYGLGLPQIVAEFNKSEYYALVGVVYSLTQAIVAPIVATLGDRLGRKWLNVGSLALMCVFLVMTYFANSFVLFLISWALCGVAVGGFMTGPFLIVMDVYEQKDWGKMSGNLVTALSAGMIVGPIVGGLLVDAGSLRGIFLLPIPFFIVAGIIQYIYYPNKKREGKHSFDTLGVIWLVLAMVPFVAILNFAGNMFPWKSAITFVLAAVTIISAVLLYRRETRVAQPAFALGALKNRYVLISCLTCLLASAYSVLSAGFLVYFAQAVLQVSATSSATLLMPQVIVSLFLPQIVGRWVSKDSRRYKTALWLMGIALAVTLIGISMIKVGSSIVILYALMAVGGIGYTFLNNCIAPFISMHIAPSEMGAANGCKGFFTTLGVTIMGSVFGMMLGMFQDFTVAISRVFLVGGICCLIVTPLILIFVKNEPRAES